MLAGADSAGSEEHSTAVAAENSSHGGRIDGSCLVIGGEDSPTERLKEVGHQALFLGTPTRTPTLCIYETDDKYIAYDQYK